MGVRMFRTGTLMIFGVCLLVAIFVSGVVGAMLVFVMCLVSMVTARLSAVV